MGAGCLVHPPGHGDRRLDSFRRLPGGVLHRGHRAAGASHPAAAAGDASPPQEGSVGRPWSLLVEEAIRGIKDFLSCPWQTKAVRDTYDVLDGLEDRAGGTLLGVQP